MQLFSEALELAREERDAFLEEACGEDIELAGQVRAMLTADGDSKQFLSGTAATDLLAEETPASAEQLPRPFAGYQLKQVLGRGGMATVYLAEQESPKREVAIKVMNPLLTSAESEERLRLEAELLARLEHPGIAQVFESSLAEEGALHRPYFAMERVQGGDLLEYAQQAKLSVAERLELMVEVCDAIQHAHQKGVLHRDLKPGNVLVTAEGKPKVLDFGIGRLLDASDRNREHATIPGMVLGTPEYMSPEQAAGETERVDTRSDVYSLGVLVFELVSGRLPVEVRRASLTEALRRVHTDEPKRLGESARPFGADLETIVAKALEKEPDRRYSSAEALAADLRRLLASEPILARPATTSYRLRKFVARNRGLSAGIAVATVAMIAATGLSLRWAWVAERAAEESEAAKTRALDEAQLNSQVVAFVERLFEAAIPNVADGQPLTVVEVVESGREELDEEFPADGWAGARIRAFLGHVLIATGDFDAAEELLDEALEPLRRLHGDRDSRVLTVEADLARVLGRHQDFQPSIELYHSVLKRSDPADPSHTDVRAQCHLGLGYLQRSRENLKSAESHFRSAIELLEERGAPALRQAQTWADLASVLTESERLDESHAALNRAEELAGGKRSLLFLSKLSTQRGHLHVHVGNLDAANEAMAGSLAAAERAVDGDHPMLVQLLQNLAGVRGMAGRIDEAEDLLQRAVSIADRVAGVPPLSLAQALQNLGNCRLFANDVEGAMVYWERALQIVTEVSGPESRSAASLYNTIAEGHVALGNEDKAAELRERAARIRGQDN